MDVDAYDHIETFLPAVPCPWAGLGEWGGRYTHVQGSYALNMGIRMHELGHNLGLSHASLATMSSTGLDDFSEYGDEADPMGTGSPTVVGFGLPNVVGLGWMDDQVRVRVRVRVKGEEEW